MIIKPLVESAVKSVASSVTALPQTLSLPTAIPTASAAVATLARGGGAALDLTRTRVRLEGLYQYATITTLLLNSALRLYSSTPRKLDGPAYVNIAKIIFAFCAAISVVTSGYTTVVFALLALYYKHMLGMGQDDAFL